MIESFNKKELEEQIDKYVNGQLDHQEIDELWIELIQDDYHLDYLKSVANLKAVIENKREKKRKRKVRKTWTFTAAAIIIVLVAVLGVLNLQTSSSPDVQPVAGIELDYYRSAEGDAASETGKKVIREAIELANTGKFNEAVTLLNQEIEKSDDPQWISELSLNAGALHYNRENFNQAISYFDRVVEHKDAVNVLTLEKAYWYLGNTYFQLDKLDKARTNIKKAYELNGAYRRVAKSYLNALAS